MRFILALIFILFASAIFAANVYIDPDCGTPGNGSTGTCDNDGDDPLNDWGAISFNVANDYYQKCATTWNTSANISIIGKDASALNRMIIGAYYLSGDTEIIGVSGAKPILNQTPHDDYLFYLRNSDYLHFKDLDLRGGYKMIDMGGGGVSYLLIEDCILGKGTYQYAIYSDAAQTGEDPNNYGEIRNCTFDSDIESSGASPADEGGTLQDGIMFHNGHNYWEIHDNTFIDWPHGAVSLYGYAGHVNDIDAQNSYNKVYNNYIKKESTTWTYFRGIVGVGDSYLHHNEFYYNLIENTTVRSQFGGHNNKFYYNIIDTVLDLTSGNYVSGGFYVLGSTIWGTAMDAVENEIFNNVIINTAHAGLWIGSSVDGGDLYDNVFANNIVYNCGNGYDGAWSQWAGVAVWQANYATVLDQVYYNNIVYNDTYTDTTYFKGVTETVSEFNDRDGVDNWIIQDNFSSNPNLTDIDNNDFRLSAGSPAIGAALITYTSATDYIGTTVPQGVDPDIGALEFVILDPGPEDGIEFNPAGKYLRFDTGGIPLVIP